MDNTMIPTVAIPKEMSFYDALKEVFNAKRITRLSWKNSDYGFLLDGYLVIYRDGNHHTWKVSDGDMEGVDWVVIPTIDVK